MTITIKLKTDNAAFEDRDSEVARIVQRVAQRIAEHGPDYYSLGSKLLDSNGNTVGTVKVTGR